jgi:D-alanyl-D-alanine carboxypeptidase
MADESMQVPNEPKEYLQPDTEIPVKLDSLEADGVRPRVGDSVTIRIEGTVKSIENDCAYVLADAINDTDLEEILAEHGAQNEDAMMEKLTKQADMGQMGPGGQYG